MYIGFSCGGGLPVVGQNPQEIYDLNVGGTNNLWPRPETRGWSKLIYTSTVATIAVDRPELPSEATHAKLEEMIGHYRGSKWMAEQEVLREARAGLPAIVAMPTTPAAPWDWKLTRRERLFWTF